MLHENARRFSKEFFLSNEDKVFVEFMQSSHGITEAKLVYISKIDGIDHVVARYDSAHGFFHLDALFEPKQPKFVTVSPTSRESVFELLQTIRAHFEEWKHKYIQNHLRKWKQ